MTHYIGYLDETGTISSPAPDEEYGYGICIIREDYHTNSLEESVKKAFPNGFHLKGIRGDRKKIKKARKLLRLLSDAEIFGAAHVFADKEYARNLYSAALIKAAERQDRDKSRAPEGIARRRVGDAHVIAPRDLEPETYLIARMLQFYNLALCNPVVALLNTVDDPENASINIRIGAVGEEQRFFRKLASIKKPLEDSLPRLFYRLFKAGKLKTIPKEPLVVTPVRGARDHPLFGYADLFAGVGLHYYKERSAPGYSLGKELYELVRHIFVRLPTVPPRLQMAPGMTCWEEKDVREGPLSFLQ